MNGPPISIVWQRLFSTGSPDGFDPLDHGLLKIFVESVLCGLSGPRDLE